MLDLNERHVEVLSPMDAARLEELLAWSDLALVVEVGGAVAGFVLTVPAGSTYDSDYYRWFAERHGSGFGYLDRVVVDGPFQRRGLASLVYDAVEAHARPAGRLALEVNTVPANEPSLAFHRARGYVEVGTLPEGPGPHAKQVAMMVKEL